LSVDQRVLTCRAENPRDLDELPAGYKAAVLRLLSPELPLDVVVERIDDENYWQRRCDLTFDLSKVRSCPLCPR